MGWRNADRDFLALLARNGIRRQGFNLLMALKLFFEFYAEHQYEDCAGDQLNVRWQPALASFNPETGLQLPPPHAAVLVVGVTRVLTETDIRGRAAWNPQHSGVPLNIGVAVDLPMAPALAGLGTNELWCHRRADFPEFRRRIRAHPLLPAAGTKDPTAVIQCVGSDTRALVGPLP